MKFNKSKPKSVIEQVLADKRKSVAEIPDNFKVSFQYLDSTQRDGCSFKHWQEIGLLSKALELLQGYCCRTLMEQVDGVKFTIYGDFPGAGFTLFECPINVPEDANWARIHVTGPAILAGHIVGSTFYVVFLDKYHSFYLTKKRREQLGFNPKNKK